MKRLLVNLFNFAKITPLSFVGIIFFLFFSLLLFVGDGKQEFVDVVGAMLSVSLFVLLYFTKKILVVPKFIATLFILLFLIVLLSFLWSDDFGYSLYFLIRFFEAFLVYVVFYSMASMESITLYIKGVTLIVFVAIIGFLASLLLPQLMDDLLPQMNLLVFYFGHNHLAGLLLLSLPIFAINLYRKRPYSRILFFVVVGVLVATYARGAWVLASVFLVCFLVIRFVRKNLPSKTLFIGGIITILIVFASVVFFLLNPQPFFGMQKTKATQDVRVVYWKQATTAFSERFLIGSGPGTFFLQSLRLRHVHSNYSWFAHSFPLEILTEMGLIGAIIIFSLFVYPWVLFINWLRKADQRSPSSLSTVEMVSFGLSLTILYGFIEFNLNFLIIWFLYWSGLGLLSGLQKKESKNEFRSFRLGVCVCVVLMFFYITSAMRMIIPFNPVVVFLNAYHVRFTKEYINHLTELDVQLPDSYARIVLFFHPRHPEILYTLGAYAEKNGDIDQAKKFYQEASGLEPINWQHYLSLVKLLATIRESSLIEETLKKQANRTLSKTQSQRIADVAMSDIPLDEIYMSFDSNQFHTNDESGLFFAKQLYLIGKTLLGVNPEKTRELWEISRDLYPRLGVLYAELASLEYYTLNNQKRALQIVFECNHIPEARLHCINLSPTLDNLTLPGELQEPILAH